MICIEFLATERATSLGEAHISPHHLEKHHLTRSHSYASGDCNPCTSFAALQESGWALTGGPFRLGVRLQLEVLRTYPVQSLLIQFPLDLGCLANVPRTVGVRFLSQRWIVTLISHQARHRGCLPRLFLRLLRRDRFFDASNNIRPPLAKAFEIKRLYEFRQRQLPWLLVMVVQLPELLWVHPQLTRHLNVLMRQLELQLS
jgi:hypothetical protein